MEWGEVNHYGQPGCNILLNDIVKTFLVNRYSRVRGEFGLAGGENVEASSPNQLSALTQVPHLARQQHQQQHQHQALAPTTEKYC